MPPSILALHYWAGAGRAFDLVGRQLPASQRLLAPDLPGYGARLPPPGFDYSVGSYADWLGDFMGANHLSEYILVGHSRGAKSRWRGPRGSRLGCGGCCCSHPRLPGQSP